MLFDFFRILRKSFKTSDIATYIEDILFWTLTGILVLYSIFVFNNGEIRLFIFLAIGVGVFAYMILFSNYIIKINVAVINIIKKIILRIMHILIIPFKYLYKAIRKLFFKPISFMIINVRNITKKTTEISKKIIKFPKAHKKLQNN